jgi:hypothetical protein
MSGTKIVNRFLWAAVLIEEQAFSAMTTWNPRATAYLAVDSTLKFAEILARAIVSARRSLKSASRFV